MSLLDLQGIKAPKGGKDGDDDSKDGGGWFGGSCLSLLLC
jgi:Lanthionine-containing peptide SapB precursor RamS